ncbi:MAG TPA: hypothetical protein VD699_04795 [Nitrosopumilaceae archaeon]|nr:hypothetical protein [Nitrosopumilaceae archaeon]
MKTNLQRIVAMNFIALILLVPAGQVTKTFGDESKIETGSVNDITLKTAFHFREGTEYINTFKNFDTMSSGFDRTKPLSFKLEGVIGWDRPILYHAIDQTFEQGKIGNLDYSEFDVDVIFQHGDQSFRQFSYGDCQIKNYNVYTEYDKEETYNEKTKFVYLDRIEFDCRGFALGNPTYEKMLQDKKAEKISEALKNIEQKKSGKK